MYQRVWCYLLMGLFAPGILFAFALLFGSDSYQYWGDRYHIDLTNKYLYSRLPHDSVLGPLWRDDTLGGNLWIVSLVTSPLSLDVLAGRYFHLSPFGIELIGTLLLYVLAVVSMYLYLRRSLHLSMEASTAASVIFAATAYWDYSLNTNPNIPMAVAWLPALLAMSHRIDDMSRCRGRVLQAFIGLALLVFVCAIHSTVATLPITLFLVAAYAVAVFVRKRSVFWILFALGTGLLLYSPFLWLFVEAAQLSHRNTGTGFYSNQSLGWFQWITQAKVMLFQIGLGVNRYGLYLVVTLGILIWLCTGRRWNQEPSQRRKILLFAGCLFSAIFAIELFHEAINDVKRTIPLLRGWNVIRFADFAFFGLAVLIAWMFDQSLFRAGQEELSPRRRTALRFVLAVTGIVGGLQVAFYVSRMREMPPGIYPQDLVLYGCLFLYAFVLLGLLALFYHQTHQTSFALKKEGADAHVALWCVILLGLAVCLVTSLHAYRSGLVKPQGIDVAGPASIMTYTQRYMVPEEVLALARLGDEGRALDLTRPLHDGTWMVGSEITMLPLSGLRILSGYSNLYPAWYGRLIQTGVNGQSGRLWNIVQVEETDRTNLEVLPLLDVRQVLARESIALPHYHAVAKFKSKKTLYALDKQSRVGPVFVSRDVRCFADEEGALEAIHEADLPRLLDRAFLVASDTTSRSICAGEFGHATNGLSSSTSIHSKRATDRVSVEVQDSPGGVLTLSDTYYPGWRVFVNGVEKPILRSYVALRGVLIEPGKQSIEFVYDPKMFSFLLVFSSITLALILIIGAGVWTRERIRRYR